MSKTMQQSPLIHKNPSKIVLFWKRKIWKERYMYLFILPGLLFFIIYRYIPMLGSLIAFQDYSPFSGFINSPWVGLKHFKIIFKDQEVIRVLWNTLYISVMQIVFVFPAPIIIALMLNELRNPLFKKFIQSVVYLPHFLSWVVIASMAVIFLKSEGIVNQLLHAAFGTDPIPFLTKTYFFVPLVVLEVIWKEVGWGTIIFLAALAGVNSELYEAAVMDGASRMRRIWHVTLPALSGTIVILLILRLGTILDSGFEQIFLMLNPFNMEVGNVFDTYVYFKGIRQSDYSFATAVGLFKGIIGLILVVCANRIAKKMGGDGLY